MYQIDGLNILADTAKPVVNWADTYLLPEDRLMIFAALEAAIRTKSSFELEHRVHQARRWRRLGCLPARVRHPLRAGDRL
jgi:hypothetical protein